MAAAAERFRVDAHEVMANLLDEVDWWQTDDFWWYALAAAVAVIRACADRMHLSAPAFVQQLSAP